MTSITVWTESMVALYWILNPGKSWKVFVANTVCKITQIEDGSFTQKLTEHVHAQIRHLGVGNTMAALMEKWWIPRVRTLVKEIRNCNICKVFATKPYRTLTNTTTV